MGAAWKKEISSPVTRYAHFRAEHLELIARYGAAFQDRLLDDLRKSLWRLPISVAQLQKELDVYQTKLSGALWRLDDPTLVPQAGPCSTCVKRASCQPGLFGVETAVEAKNDYCLDTKCFARKMRAHLERRATELREKYPNLVLLERGYRERGLKGSIRDAAVEKAKKSDKGARPALVTAGPGKGSLTWVRLTRDDAHEVGPVTAREIAKRKAEKEAELRVMDAFAGKLKGLPRPTAFDEERAISVLLAIISGGWSIDVGMALLTLPMAQLLDEAWRKLLEVLGRSVDTRLFSTPPAMLGKMAELVGVDLAEIRRRSKLSPSQPKKVK